MYTPEQAIIMAKKRTLKQMKFLQADYIWALLFTHVRCIKLSILLFSPCSAKTRKKKEICKKSRKKQQLQHFSQTDF